MMDMIARVAEAIAKAALDEGDGIVFDVHALTEEVYDTYLAQARAAIEAMQVPTEAMMKALRFYGMLDGDPEEAWEKTILAALDPTTPLHGE